MHTLPVRGTHIMSTVMGTSTQERALALLGSGVGPEQVANALGVTPSTISQLMSISEFASQVTALRYENLSKHNVRDAGYDALEDTLLEKITDAIPLVHRPLELVRILQTINGAKRRGSSAPEALTQQSTVVQLVMPVQIINKFTANINNQVIKIGEQDLLTIQSSTLLDAAKKKPEGVPNGHEQILIEQNL